MRLFWLLAALFLVPMEPVFGALGVVTGVALSALLWGLALTFILICLGIVSGGWVLSFRR